MLHTSKSCPPAACADDLDSLRARVTTCVCRFSQRLGTQRSGCLAQIWVPGVREDGSTILHTQGLPYSVAGTGDLLALFRCVSCRYKFGTDASQPASMVVQAEADVNFPVLMHWLKQCLQEMQLFTADVDTKLMTLGLRTSANEAGTCKALSCSSLHEQASRRIAGQGKSSSRSPEQDNHNHVGNRTHCSTSNLLSQSLMQGTNSGTSSPGRTAAAGACEMTADSKEVKEESSMNGLDSPRSSLIKDALRLGPGKSTLPPHSGDLQERDSGGSNGSADVPANTAVAGQLVHVGGCLQLQTHIASQDVQLLSPASSVRIKTESIDNASSSKPSFRVGVQAQMQSPFQHHTAQQQQQQLLQSMLASAAKAPAQLQVPQPPAASPFANASASIGQQAFGSGGVFMSQASTMLQQPLALPEDDEAASPRDGGTVNNRVAGGAGKRLCVEDLQSQFGVGLREAAHNLRICPTTLKRACRRHGITRWPRRQTWTNEGGGRLIEAPSEPLTSDVESVSPVPASKAELGTQHMPIQLGAGQSVRSLTALSRQTAGARTLSGSLLRSGVTNVAGLESLTAFTPPAQIALLQQLTAKAEPADSKWLQGQQMQAALQTSVSADPALKAPNRQLGSGAIVNMIANNASSSQQPFRLAPVSGSLHQATASASLARGGDARLQLWPTSTAPVLTPFAQQNGLQQAHHGGQQQGLQHEQGPQHARQQGSQHAQQQGAQHAQQQGAQHAQQQGSQHAQQQGAQQQGSQHAQQPGLQNAQHYALLVQLQQQQSSLQQLRRVQSVTPPPVPGFSRSRLPLASASSLPPPPAPTAHLPAPADVLADTKLPQYTPAWLQQLSSAASTAHSTVMMNSMLMHNSMGAQSGRDNPWHGTNAIPNIAPDQMPQSAMHTTSDQVNAKSALFTPNLMVDEALNHGQVMMQLDPPDHGLGCLDIPDISMENLGSIDLDPSDCLF